MDALIYLIPVALFLGALGLVGFLWSLKSGQFEDMEGPAMRAISDDDLMTADEQRSKSGPGHEGKDG